MLTVSRSILRRSSIRRPRFDLQFSTAAYGTSCQHDWDRTDIVRRVAGVLAVAGSAALGLICISSSPDSLVSFADSELGKGDSCQEFAFRKLFKERESKFLFNDSFRRRVFFNYEKRIRLQSSPEKIFEYFASFRSQNGEVLMLPADLMRAIVPVFPPSESKLVREGHLRGERHSSDLYCAPSTFFMLFDTNGDGLISFAEYIFFVTLLSIPESSFSTAFKMFDLNHNGEIDKEEFKKVMALMRSFNRQGASHRNGLRIGLKVGRSVDNGGLVQYFFGEDGQGRLKHDKFVQFLKDLHEEILRLEFAHYDWKSSGTISAMDFALSMVASADVNHINKLLDRVDEVGQLPHIRDIRISYEEFRAFAELRKKLNLLAMAMFSFGKVNGQLTKQDFEELHHILSMEEFVRALQRRETDLRQPIMAGMSGLFSSWLNSAKTRSFGQMML